MGAACLIFTKRGICLGGWREVLFERGRELGITEFSTPFDETALDLREGLGAPAYEISSFELIDLPHVRSVAKTGKPTITCTRIASSGEIAERVAAFRAAGRPRALHRRAR
jgi:sialic acid synthase SpsE